MFVAVSNRGPLDRARRVALPLPLYVPTLLLCVFKLDFSKTSTSIRSSSYLSAGGEVKNLLLPSFVFILSLQLYLYLLAEDDAEYLLAGLDGALDCEIMGAPLP